MLPDIDTVTGIVRTVAAEEVMPRFRNLADHDVAEKKHPSDLVTTADIEAEKRLVAALGDLVPGSVVIGEEGAEADPDLFQALAGAAPVWLVDPVDGTHDFARGEACFAVVVAYCLDGETRGGWILDPVTGRAAWAVAGEGAWSVDTGRDASPKKLKVAAPRAVDQMTGSLGPRLAKRAREASLAGQGAAPAGTVRYGCTGQEYLDLGAGKLDFAQYTRLKPWDHAAGVLIHAEAGGYSRLTNDGATYRPIPGIDERTLLAAPDEMAWTALHDVFG